MKFDDDEYIKRYLEHGEYPRIHDDIFSRVNIVKADNVIDLGCCTGLLSSRLAKVYKKVVGIEPCEKYLDKAVREPNIQYKCMKINKDTLEELAYIIKKYNIQAVFARRVIPELYETGGFDLVQDFVKTLSRTNVQYVIIEGRKSTSKAVNPLKNVEEEAKMFNGYFKVIDEYRECKVLRNAKL